MASARYLRRHRPGDNAGPGRHCLCSCIGPAGHLRFVRNDRAAAGLRAVRPKPHSRPWPGTRRWRQYSFEVVAPLAQGDHLRAVTLAGMMAIVSGTVCILAGVARLGFITELLSKPIRYGYMNGIALTVLIGQLPKLFGFSIESRGATAKPVGDCQRDPWGADKLGRVRDWPRHVDRDPASLRNNRRLPGLLIAVVGATLVVGSDLGTQYGCQGAGPPSPGPAGFRCPWITSSDIVPVLIGGCAVAMVSFADTSVLSRAYAARSGCRVDPNQEMVGLGAANLATGFFQGFPISSSSSRTPDADADGARTSTDGRRRRACRRVAPPGRAEPCSNNYPPPHWTPS